MHSFRTYTIVYYGCSCTNSTLHTTSRTRLLKNSVAFIQGCPQPLSVALAGNSTRQRKSQSVYPQTLYKLSLVSVRLVVHGFCPHLHACRSLSIHSINYLVIYCFTTILHNALTHSLQFSHNSINYSYMVGVPRHPIGTAFVRCQFFTAFQTGILVIWLFIPSTGAPSTMYVQFI